MNQTKNSKNGRQLIFSLKCSSFIYYFFNFAKKKIQINAVHKVKNELNLFEKSPCIHASVLGFQVSARGSNLPLSSMYHMRRSIIDRQTTSRGTSESGIGR